VKEYVSAAVLLACASLLNSRALATPFNGFVSNVIPREISQETDQNSEPSIGVNPTDVNQVLIGAFNRSPVSGTAQPYYSSSNGGLRFINDFSIQHGDTSLDWTNGGTIYGTRLDPAGGGTSRVTTSPNPTNAALPGGIVPLSPVANSALGGNTDQPWVAAATVGGKDRVYVGINNAGGAPQNDIVRYTLDAKAAAPVWNNVPLNPAPIAGGDSVPVRVAIAGNTVYSAYDQVRAAFNGNTQDAPARIVVRRSTNGGVDNFGANGANGNALTSPSGNITVPFGATTVGTERLGSDLSVAVNPNNPNDVYVAYAQVVGGQSQVEITRSTDGGETWGTGATNHLTIAGPSALPSLAVASNGEVGLLCTYLNNANRLGTLFVQATANLATQEASTLSLFPDNNPATQFDPYIGDYEDLQVVGNKFFGTFSASNNPNPANFPDVTNGVYFQRFVNVGGALQSNFFLTAAGALDDGTNAGAGMVGNPVNVSIDPYYFEVDAVPEPTSAAAIALGFGLLCRNRARRRAR
jgi:hypothetical protein